MATITGNSWAEHLLGTDGDDWIDGRGGDDRIVAGDGTDVLIGGTDDDTLQGGAGNDTLSGGDGADELFGGLGDDQIDGGAGIDTLRFGLDAVGVVVDLGAGTATGEGSDTLSLIETVIGTDHDDVLTGDDEINSLYGGAGADIINGGGGIDYLDGDLYDQSGVFAVDQLDGGAGDDFVYLGANDSGEGGAGYDVLNISLYFETEGTTIDLSAVWSGGTGTNGTGTVSGFEEVEQIVATDGADTVTVGTTGTWNENYLPVSVSGRGGDDRITGGDDRNSLTGDAGDDVLFGLGGDDELLGGSGDDWIEGGEGDDLLAGRAGIDTLVGGAGGDTYHYVDYVDFDSRPSQDHIVETEADAGLDTLYLYNMGGGQFTDADLAGVRNVEILELASIAGRAEPGLVLGAEFQATGIRTVIAGIDVDASQTNDGLTFIVTPTLNLDVTGSAGDDLFRFAEARISDGTILSGGAGIDTLLFHRSMESDVPIGQEGSGVTLSGFEAITLIGGEHAYERLGHDAAGRREEYSITLDDAMMTAGTLFAVDASGLLGDIATDLGADHKIGGTGANRDILQSDRLVLDASGLGADRAVHVLGGAGEDWLIGGAGVDEFEGGAGDDWLDGGPGADLLIGGADDDIYWIDDAGDQAVESADGGVDEIVVSFDFSLVGLEVENLSLAGSAAVGTGNAYDNIIRGNAGANVLEGGAGTDWLYGDDGSDVLTDGGGTGSDRLWGGAGADSLFVNRPAGSTPGTMVLDGEADDDVLTFFAADFFGQDAFLYGGDGNDHISVFRGGSIYIDAGVGDDRVALHFLGADYAITLGGSSGDLLVLQTNFGPYPTRGSIIVTDMRTGEDGYRIELVDYLFSVLEGWDPDSNPFATGHLALGQDGSDALLRIDRDGSGGESGFADLIRFRSKAVADFTPHNLGGYAADGGAAPPVTAYGLALPDLMWGNSGDDALYGLDDRDELFGAAGDDRLEGGEGDDWLSGQFGDDELLGQNGSDWLVGDLGDDSLNGGAGADRMTGGDGDDLYTIDDAGDGVTELPGGGIDTVRVNFSYRLGADFENLILTGGGNHNATGNGVANSLTGNGGNNRLDGGAGADTMAGGQGHDVYVVNNAADQVIEAGSSGTDTVESAVTYRLPVHFEKLILTGVLGYDGRGNAGANTITGNAGRNFLSGGSGDDRIDGGAGNDRLLGGRGRDSLTGGAGQDRFEFLTAPGADNVDRILDFSAADDSLYLMRSAFAGTGPNGTLAASAFHQGSAAADAGDRIVYDAATGNIFYDSDGTGAAAALLFATVGAGTPLTHADFVIYG